MSISFQFTALPIETFRPWLTLSDDELRARGARRVVADSKPGFPCRVSLVDAEPGETLILLPFVHHEVDSPYRASGPIFVREGAETAAPAANEVPPLLRSRLLSLRAYTSAATLVRSDVVEGPEVEEAIRRFFADPDVAYLHVHNAKAGCFSCRVERSQAS